MIVGLFIVPVYIDTATIGALPALINFTGFIALPLTLLMNTALKFISIFKQRGEQGKIDQLLRDLTWLLLAVSAGILLMVHFQSDYLQAKAKINEPKLVWFIGLTAITTCWLPLAINTARGMGYFKAIILSKLVGPVVRLLLVLLFIRQLQVTGYFAAYFLSQLAVIFFLAFCLRKSFGARSAGTSYRKHYKEICHYLFFFTLFGVTTHFIRTAETFVIRVGLTDLESGGYYMISRFGEIPYSMALAVVVFLFPLASDAYEAGEKTHKMHIQAIGLVVFIGIVFTFILACLGHWILSLNKGWASFNEFGEMMWLVSAIFTCKGVFAVHALHELSVQRFRFICYFIPIVLIETLALSKSAKIMWFTPPIPNTSQSSLSEILWIILMFWLVVAAFTVMDAVQTFGWSRKSLP